MIWLVACAQGNLRTVQGSDPVVTAFYLQEEGAERDELHVVVANSFVSSCRQPQPDDTTAFEELYLATRREGAQIARLTLHRFRKDSWVGDFPLSSDPVDTLLDDRDPFVAEGAWYHVIEAAVTDEDGLVMEYEPTEWVREQPISRGDVRVTAEGDGQVHGRFGFETLDVSGTFRAVGCRLPYDESIFPLLDLLGSVSDDDLVD